MKIRMSLAIIGVVLLSVCLLPGCGKPGPEKTIIHKELDAPYEASCGLVFFGQCGNFVKKEVHENLNPIYGTSVHYEADEVTEADVYIYSLDTKGTDVNQKAFEKECASVVGNILSTETKIDNLIEVKEIPSPEKYPDGIFAKHFLYSAKKGINFETSLLMFLYKGKIIKVRITYPGGDIAIRDDAINFERSLLKQALDKE